MVLENKRIRCYISFYIWKSYFNPLANKKNIKYVEERLQVEYLKREQGRKVVCSLKGQNHKA
jgi:hypothetical protein